MTENKHIEEALKSFKFSERFTSVEVAKKYLQIVGRPYDTVDFYTTQMVVDDYLNEKSLVIDTTDTVKVYFLKEIKETEK